MKGSETFLLPFLEGRQKYFIIPVYQRKYDWKIDNCRQLYEDLKRMLREQRPTHFFGSIVSAVVGNGSKVEYHVIDGQQRLTTVELYTKIGYKLNERFSSFVGMSAACRKAPSPAGGQK